jgi:vanillate O-demethylase ferredoxin subunit
MLRLRTHAIAWEADGVQSFEFRAPGGGELPAFTPGAHLGVRLPGGIERSYSLVNPAGERHRYVTAVHRNPDSRGGSAWMFEQLRVGDLLEVTAPENSFPLDESVDVTVLIGGGIGITPLWSMIQRLEQLGRAWRLYYAVRTRAQAAFLAELQALEARQPGRVVTVFDQEPGQSMLDIAAVVEKQPEGAHFYCCGPSGMLHAFEAATKGRPAEHVHVEYFAADQAPARGGFEVVLARSGTSFVVPVTSTILETLLAKGFDVPRSCMSGVCGTCETVVLEGIPDHRDQVLSDREKASNKKIMICCSGSLGDRLVLDI